MPTYTTIAEVRQGVLDQITNNGNKEITGLDLKDILIGMVDLISPILINDLITKQGLGNSIGGSDDSETYVAGTPLEDVIRDILTKVIHPDYQLPSVDLATTVATLLQECGVQISPQLSIVYNQHDGGASITRTLRRNASSISSSFPYTDTNITLVEGDTAYKAVVTYSQGPIKNNNLGDPDNIGQIQAGSIDSNIITYKGFRKAFYGVPVATPTDSAGVRAAGNFFLNPQVGTVINISVPQGATRVVIAYPATLQDISSMKLVENGELEVKGLFAKTTVNVEGANAYAAISYKVFTYVPIEPFAVAATIKVTV